MVAVELILLPVLIGVFLFAYIALEHTRDVIDDMPLPPYDREVEEAWDFIADREIARG